MSFALGKSEATALLESIEAGSAIPTRWYADPEIFSAELGRIHHRAWHYVTHAGELARPGDFVVRPLARVPILLVHGDDGGIRGFLNICRHRGYPVALEDGCRKRLQCRYHGWTYGLDGRLMAAPRSKGDPTFDAASLGLVPIQVQRWGAMLWANLDPEALTAR